MFEGTLLSQCLHRATGSHTIRAGHVEQGPTLHLVEIETVHFRIRSSFRVHKFYVHLPSRRFGRANGSLDRFYAS